MRLRHSFAMVTAALLRLTRWFLVALVALGLTLSAHAHRMPEDAGMVGFLQATGSTLADLCSEPQPGSSPGPRCETCQIATALPVAPPCVAPVTLRLALGAPVLPPDRGHLLPLSQDPAHPPQAPPIA